MHPSQNNCATNGNKKRGEMKIHTGLLIASRILFIKINSSPNTTAVRMAAQRNPRFMAFRLLSASSFLTLSRRFCFSAFCAASSSAQCLHSTNGRYCAKFSFFTAIPQVLQNPTVGSSLSTLSATTSSSLANVLNGTLKSFAISTIV